MTQTRERANMGMDKEQSRVGLVQVTVWGSPTDKDLMSWFAWYKDKTGKTPAAIVKKNTPGAYVVSVWRFGEGSPGCDDKFRSSYEIVEECHGFSKLAGKAGMMDAT